MENLIYIELRRYGYEVYVGTFRDKEIDFVAKKEDRVIYIQSSYILADEQTIQREYSPLESIEDNYEKFVVSLDDIAFWIVTLLLLLIMKTSNLIWLGFLMVHILPCNWKISRSLRLNQIVNICRIATD